MEANDKSVEEINTKIKLHKLFGVAYGCLFASIVMFENIQSAFASHSATFGLANLIYKLVLLLFFVCVDIYLIRMGFNM